MLSVFWALACSRLADAGIPLGAQTVLLKGVNDDVQVMKELNHKLLLMRDALTMRRSDGALVRVTVPVDRNGQAAAAEAASFIQDVIRPITQLLPE